MRPRSPIPRLAAAVLGVAAAAGPLAAAQAGEDAARGQAHARLGPWSPTLELSVDETLELRSLRSSAGGTGATGATLRLLATDASLSYGARDRAALALAGDLTLEPIRSGGLHPPAPVIVRPPVFADREPGSTLAVGAEYVFRVANEPRADGADWGYLRILDVEELGARVELVTAAARVERIQRDPLFAAVEPEPAGQRIRWTPAGSEPDEPRTYAVFRRALGSTADAGEGASDAASTWALVARVDGRTAIDPAPPISGAAEYAIQRVDADGEPLEGFVGALVRSVRSETSLEGWFDAGVGARVDLLAGRVAGPGEVAHVELGQSAPGSIAMRPIEGTRLGLSRRLSRDDPERSWWLLPPGDPSLIAGRTTILDDGGEVEFRVGARLQGRVRVERTEGDQWRIRREISLGSTRILPRPLAAVPTTRWEPMGTVGVASGPLDPQAGIAAELVSLVVERERIFGDGVWQEVAEGAPGERSVELQGLFERASVDPLDGPAPVVRLRARQRIAFGARSLPTEPFALLAAGDDPSARAAALEEATLALDDSVFQRRMEARAVLRTLGEEARPALEAIATGDLGPRGLAAREVLESIEAGDLTTRGAARRLRRHAFELARLDPEWSSVDDGVLDLWLGETPTGLLEPQAAARAHRLLLLADRAERGVSRGEGPPGDVAEDCRRVELWAGAVARSDPDAGVRSLAGFIAEIGLLPSLASFEAAGPAYLLPLAERAGDISFASRTWLELPGSGEELAWSLERRPELGDLDLGPPLARLLHALRSVRPGERAPGAPPRYFDYDAPTADLVLRLVERATVSSESRSLLDAAEALLPGESRTLAAWREVIDRRLASPSASAMRRREVVVGAPDLDLLVGALRQLQTDGDGAAKAGAVGVDVLLSPGVYTSGAGAESELLEIRRDGIRLRAAEPGSRVELRCGIRVRGARDVVFEGIELVHDAGSALTLLDGAHALALRSRIAGAGSVIYAQDSDLELVECLVDGADVGKPPQWAVRQLGRSRLFARATSMNAGTVFLSDESWNLLDRCVLDAGPRTLVQAQRSGHLVARESLLRGTNLGLYNIGRGVLAAVVVDVQRDPLGRRPSGLRVSPRLFHLVGSGQRVPPSMRLSAEPLQPR